MKRLTDNIADNNASFKTRRDDFPQYHNTWHYHEELEFIYIHRGSGTFFIGDCIKSFEAGTCVLIGKNVPHYWLFNDEYLSNKKTEVYVIHFRDHFAGEDFLHLPELTKMRLLFEKAQKGLFCAQAEAMLAMLFTNILSTKDSMRVIMLLQALHHFDEISAKTELVSSDYIHHLQDEDFRRMNTIMAFLMKNFRNEVELKTLADGSGMTKNSFCRYFKQKTGKTLTEFVTELKVAHACKLLKNPQNSVKTCCYESGFNNLVSFHKAFRNITGVTPKSYKLDSKNANKSTHGISGTRHES